MTLIGSSKHVTNVWGREEKRWPGVAQWSDCGQWCTYLWTLCFECFQYRKIAKVWVIFVYFDLNTKLYPCIKRVLSFVQWWSQFLYLLAFAFETCFIMSDQVTAEPSLWLLPAAALVFALAPPPAPHSVLSSHCSLRFLRQTCLVGVLGLLFLCMILGIISIADCLATTK